MSQNRNPPFGSLASLRGPARARAPEQSCDLCATELGREHAHLLEPERRRVLCACPGCVLLLGSGSNRRFRHIPAAVRLLGECPHLDVPWAGLGIPINLAFLFRSSRDNHVVALYPSPAGVTESLIDPESWGQMAAAEPALGALEEDVQALLVNRLKQPFQHFIAPIDSCFRLVGLIRVHWKGFSGGRELWKEVDAFFAEMRQAAEPSSPRRLDGARDLSSRGAA